MLANPLPGNPLNILMQLLNSGLGSDGFDEARQANESRYNDILELLGLNRKRTMDSLKDFGDSLTNDANYEFDKNRNNLLTDLAERGMGGSTERAAIENRNLEARLRTLGNIKDKLVENYTQADERLTGNATGVMERRSDPYPEQNNTINQLAAMLGSGMLGGGGGGRQSLPGQAGPVGTPGMSATQPLKLGFAESQALIRNSDAEFARGSRNAKASLKQAMDGSASNSLQQMDKINAVQTQAIRDGYADWGPNQPAPVVPGAVDTIIPPDPQLQQQISDLYNRLQNQGAAQQDQAQQGQTQQAQPGATGGMTGNPWPSGPYTAVPAGNPWPTPSATLPGFGGDATSGMFDPLAIAMAQAQALRGKKGGSRTVLGVPYRSGGAIPFI